MWAVLSFALALALLCVLKLVGNPYGWQSGVTAPPSPRYHEMYAAARDIVERTGDAVLARDLFHLKHRHWVAEDLYHSWLEVVRRSGEPSSSVSVRALPGRLSGLSVP